MEVDNGYTLCYDSLSGRYFKADVAMIMKSVDELNRRFYEKSSSGILVPSIDLNELYDAIGIEPIGIGCKLRWNSPVEINFVHNIYNDEPCVVLVYKEPPLYIHN